MGFFGFFRHKKHFFRDVDFNSDAPPLQSISKIRVCFFLLFDFWQVEKLKSTKYIYQKKTQADF